MKTNYYTNKIKDYESDALLELYKSQYIESKKREETLSEADIIWVSDDQIEEFYYGMTFEEE